MLQFALYELILSFFLSIQICNSSMGFCLTMPALLTWQSYFPVQGHTMGYWYFKMLIINFNPFLNKPTLSQFFYIIFENITHFLFKYFRIRQFWKSMIISIIQMVFQMDAKFPFIIFINRYMYAKIIFLFCFSANFITYSG